LGSPTVELKVPVATPLAFVGPGCVRVLVLPVAVRTTVAPASGLPLASLAVTVMVDVLLPASIVVGEAETVDCVALTDPGVPVAVKVTGLPLIPDPTAVAVSVLVPAVVPSVHAVTAAIPLVVVVTAVVGFTVPPPVATANVNATPAPGLAAPLPPDTDRGG